ncbi:hypothetical protein EGW08_018366 [Elysia chlorotica]|uniref:Uncharacterized protein n=1 Tax=Elysia chlorotica TaxID=188477 RepID=A0A433SX31_ELYCH|nr:hypothetical protein EGW08_018366 [Elysia chlorotica]
MILVPGPCYPATHNQMFICGPYETVLTKSSHSQHDLSTWTMESSNSQHDPRYLFCAPFYPVTLNQMFIFGPFDSGLFNFWVNPEPMILFQLSTSLAATEINPQAQLQAQQDFGMDGRGDEQVPNEQMLETIAIMIVYLDVSNKQSDKFIETLQFREETNDNASNDSTSDTIFLSLSQNLNAHGIWHCCYDCSTCQSLKVNADPLGCKDKWDQAVNRERIYGGQQT